MCQACTAAKQPGKPAGGLYMMGCAQCCARLVRSAPHLRYDERNAHAQRKQCNRWGAGRAVDYRLGLIERISLQEVEALEADNTLRKYTADELRAIKTLYREKLKNLTDVSTTYENEQTQSRWFFAGGPSLDDAHSAKGGLI